MTTTVLKLFETIDSLSEPDRASYDAEVLRRIQSARGKLGGGARGDSRYYRKLALKAVAARRKLASKAKPALT